MTIRNRTRPGQAVCRTAGWFALALALGCSPTARNTVTVTPPVSAPVESASEAVNDGLESAALPTDGNALTDEARADYEAAVDMLEQAQYESGIALLLSVTEQAPSLTSAHIDLGIAYARSGDLDRAEVSLKQALESSPQESQSVGSDLETDATDVPDSDLKAELDVDSATTDPDAALDESLETRQVTTAYNELGMVQRRKGQFEAARASYEAALAESPDSYQAHRNLGILCDLYLADYTCALQHYETYGRLVPDDADVAKWIADVSARSRQPGTP